MLLLKRKRNNFHKMFAIITEKTRLSEFFAYFYMTLPSKKITLLLCVLILLGGAFYFVFGPSQKITYIAPVASITPTESPILAKDSVKAAALIKQGAYIDFIDKRFEGQATPLIGATIKGESEIVDLLISSGARVDRDDKIDRSA